MIVEHSLKETEVSALDLEPPLVLDQRCDVRTVLEHMRERQSGYALLTKEGRLTGIFTERDALLRILPDEGALGDPILCWMTREPASVTVHAPLGVVLERMRRGGFRRVAVVGDRGEVVGCIRQRDLVTYLARYDAGRAPVALPIPD